MRRISLVCATVLVASVAAVSLSLVIVPEAKSESGKRVSQGSVVDPDSRAAVAAQKDIAEEEKLPDYSQVVDNTTEDRFQAPKWQVRSSDSSHGGSYVTASSGAPARFEVKIPSDNDYSVYAWWPEAAVDSTEARFGVGTASGTKWGNIDQRNEGGMWIKLGTYSMEKGERVVQIASASGDAGTVAADAVAVIRGESLMPPEPTNGESGGSDLSARATATRSASGYDVVRQARKYKGTPYRYGTCTTYRMSCTCLTKKTVSPFGHNMPLTEIGQWRYDRSVYVRYSKLAPGDEVFFKENGRSGPITHVGIYSGNGMIVHASSYFGRVVEKQMKYINGYAGAKRFRLP